MRIPSRARTHTHTHKQTNITQSSSPLHAWFWHKGDTKDNNLELCKHLKVCGTCVAHRTLLRVQCTCTTHVPSIRPKCEKNQWLKHASEFFSYCMQKPWTSLARIFTNDWYNHYESHTDVEDSTPSSCLIFFAPGLSWPCSGELRTFEVFVGVSREAPLPTRLFPKSKCSRSVVKSGCLGIKNVCLPTHDLRTWVRVSGMFHRHDLA